MISLSGRLVAFRRQSYVGEGPNKAAALTERGLIEHSKGTGKLKRIFMGMSIAMREGNSLPDNPRSLFYRRQHWIPVCDFGRDVEDGQRIRYRDE